MTEKKEKDLKQNKEEPSKEIKKNDASSENKIEKTKVQKNFCVSNRLSAATLVDIPYDSILKSWSAAQSVLEEDNTKMMETLANANFELNHSYLQLQENINSLTQDLFRVPQKETNEKILEEKVMHLKKKMNLRHLISRVNQKAQEKLYKSQSFVAKFEPQEICNTVVISIDIRRSTELMLKAKSPNHFAKFITDLSKNMIKIIKDNFGVFDKFTGDGILAFFPDFFSGPDSYYYALKTAYECHCCFRELYDKSRECFTTILKDIGLGIGIDSGKANLSVINDELTIVGTPVVYACRLSRAEPDVTLINQSAFEEIKTRYYEHITTEVTDIKLEHEGTVLAYIINLNFDKIDPKIPKWENFPNEKSKE